MTLDLAIFPLTRRREVTASKENVRVATRECAIDMLHDELLQRILEQLRCVNLDIHFPLDAYSFGLVSRRWRAVAIRYTDQNASYRECVRKSTRMHLDSLAFAVTLVAARGCVESGPPRALRWIFDQFKYVRVRLPHDRDDQSLAKIQAWSGQLRIRHLDLIGRDLLPPTPECKLSFDQRLESAAVLMNSLASRPDRRRITVSIGLEGPSAPAEPSSSHAYFIDTLKRCDMVVTLSAWRFPGLPALLAAVPQLTRLRRVDLRNNQIADVPADARNASVAQVIHMLESGASLWFVDLRENLISVSGRKILRAISDRYRVTLLLDSASSSSRTD